MREEAWYCKMHKDAKGGQADRQAYEQAGGGRMGVFSRDSRLEASVCHGRVEWLMCPCWPLQQGSRATISRERASTLVI